MKLPIKVVFCPFFSKLLKIIRFCFPSIELLKIYVVVNFLYQVIFVFLLFLGMVMYANEIETKEK